MVRTNTKAFHFCKNLFLLLATCNDCSCNKCDLDSTFLAYDSSVVRKRRPAKPKEVADATRTRKPIPVVFQLGKYRTAKHKKYAWTADSGATIAVTNRLDIFETIDNPAPNKVEV